VPPSRLEADPTATVLRFQGLAEFRPLPNLTLAFGARGQYSRKPLLSLEEFSAGNYTVGRGYDPGILLGDSGAGFQSEIRYGSLMGAPGATLFQSYAFFDLARVANRDLAFVATGQQSLASAGAGVRLSFRDRFRLDALLAVPLEPAGLQSRRGDPRLLLSLSTRFSSGSSR
jgi:hemolysin activation/secretion protein